MSTKRKKPSGSEFRKSAKLIKEKKELSINTTRKLDSFFLLNEHKTAHGSETSTTDSLASPVDSSQSLEVAPVEITQDVNTPNYECRNELASSTSGVFTTDPADWDINNQTIDFVAMNGFSQNSDEDFSASKRTFDGVTRYLNKSLFFRIPPLKNGIFYSTNELEKMVSRSDFEITFEQDSEDDNAEMQHNFEEELQPTDELEIPSPTLRTPDHFKAQPDLL
ncbi:hypothetical protein RN001_016420 [Aquatica leii]|uniref:Uncharacterized protein n=1 Tax=Aquatica leii TaxID=1421715 RepID=A0AAN7S651_9COLE|nr:hypothetical protein RN001_016420 [Aquatica leii]